MSENIAKDLLDTVKQYNVFSYVGFEGRSERLSFVYTVAILAFFTALVFSKTVISSPLSCYFPVLPKDNGKGFVSMLESYCWVNGTYLVLDNDKVPKIAEEWAAVTDRIDYYQLAAFVLGMQCLLFYLPFRLWRKSCFSLVQVDCNNLISTATSASLEMDVDKKKKSVSIIAQRIRALVSDIQCKDHRRGQSKRGKIPFRFSGRKMTILFVVFKIIYAVNAIGQFAQMTKVFGWINPHSLLQQSLYNTPFTANSTIERIFPLVTLCYFPDALGVGATNHYVGQCNLTINMILGKMYIFLYFWTLMVAVVSLGSIVLCLYESLVFNSRYRLIKGLLRINNAYVKSDSRVVQQFVEEYLDRDGVLVVRRLKDSVNVSIAAAVVEHLLKEFRENVPFREPLIPLPLVPLETEILAIIQETS